MTFTKSILLEARWVDDNGDSCSVEYELGMTNLNKNAYKCTCRLNGLVVGEIVDDNCDVYRTEYQMGFSKEQGKAFYDWIMKRVVNFKRVVEL